LLILIFAFDLNTLIPKRNGGRTNGSYGGAGIPSSPIFNFISGRLLKNTLNDAKTFTCACSSFIGLGHLFGIIYCSFFVGFKSI
jgi:hypothetical protein